MAENGADGAKSMQPEMGHFGKKKAPMRQYNVQSPFERIAIDIAGPFPETDSGNINAFWW